MNLVVTKKQEKKLQKDRHWIKVKPLIRMDGLKIRYMTKKEKDEIVNLFK